ncbi:GH25 family lysozyme [Alloscardovia macacae]|uniref:Glycosyl hydrolase family 25 n=1 Tax=Alloscardovia macacae TaxID=1160091 RepID=A0A261F224_9BIFI|nr:GH25 family lysozyme [Alloscardovia macacae]OZG53115.1 glycosyl hydrolase family 25 [Alloscardovia macacae]
MALQGIDISNWQNGINLAVVPADFVMVKVTQGASYISPDAARQVEQARSLGRPFGVYMYVGGGNAEREADFFIDNIQNWIGHGVLAVDWERGDNDAWGNTDYLRRVIAQVIKRTGIPPLLYAGASGFPWDVAREYNCATWVAQYADTKHTTGYQDTPWNEGAYACAKRQYASTGRLPGYGGNLDLNKFYGGVDAWQKIANPQNTQPAPVPAPVAPVLEGDVVDLVIAVRRGEYGNNPERAQKLGARAEEVQGLINHIATASVDELVAETWAGKYGNGDRRTNVLGERAEEVRNAINGAAQHTIHTVSRGETLSSIAAKYGTNWQHLAQINGLNNPNLIYAGQRITIK